MNDDTAQRDIANLIAIVKYATGDDRISVAVPLLRKAFLELTSAILGGSVSSSSLIGHGHLIQIRRITSELIDEIITQDPNCKSEISTIIDNSHRER